LYMTIISSRRNPLVKRLRSLASREGREEHSLLLLEGTHLLKEVLITNLYPKEIVATTTWLERNPQIIDRVSKYCLLREVTQDVLEAALSTVSPDGVATLFPLKGLPKETTQENFVLALDRLQDPGNLGSLLRTALAAEVDSVWLSSGADPLSPKTLRASSGAILHIPHIRFGKSEEEASTLFAEKLREAAIKGKQILGTVVSGFQSPHSVIPYWEIDWKIPTVLILGNEGSGLHPSLHNFCTQLITLPHSSGIDSLNVAAAAAPLLLERFRSKMISTKEQQG